MSQNIFTSQHNEDILLAQIFNRRQGTCIEVGGYDGINLSNTLFFERAGWDCLIVEPMPDFCKKIRQNRNCKVVEAAACATSGTIDFFIAEGHEVLSTCAYQDKDLERIALAGATTQKITVIAMTLDEILEKNCIFSIDFVSIDVEGSELSVLQGFSLEKFKPRIIIIEDNDISIDNSVRFFLSQRGYKRFKRTGCNDWYAMGDDPLVNQVSIMKASIKEFPITIKKYLKTYLPLPLQKDYRYLRDKYLRI